MEKWIYNFGDGSADGKASMKNLLGGKGANLAEMSNLGLPVPPGFTITTEVCKKYFDNNKAANNVGLWKNYHNQSVMDKIYEALKDDCIKCEY